MNKPATIIPIAKSKISAAKAKQVLQENGLQVTEQQAAAITGFLYQLATITNNNSEKGRTLKTST